MATSPPDTPIVAVDCDDEYLIDYLFEVNGYLIIKDAVAAEDIAQMNAWADAHWDYMEKTLRGGREGRPDGE